MTGFDTRFATSAEIPVIVRHRREMFAEMGYILPKFPADMDTRFEAWVKAHMADSTYIHWLAVEAETDSIAASAAVWIMDWPAGPLNPHKPRPYILNVYTEPEFRRKGLANMLMGEIVAWCKAQGYGIVTLHASDAGRPVYEKLGFVKTNEMRLMLGG